MPDTAELTYKLAKRFYAEFVDFRRELASVGAPLATLEPDQASIDGDLAGSNPPPPGGGGAEGDGGGGLPPFVGR